MVHAGKGALVALGRRPQRISVMPKYDIVAAMIGYMPDDEFFPMGRFIDDIVAAVKSDNVSTPDAPTTGRGAFPLRAASPSMDRMLRWAASCGRRSAIARQGRRPAAEPLRSLLPEPGAAVRRRVNRRTRHG